MTRAASCIVLAGGLGTRLRSVLNDTPKCLAPVDGQPFLHRQLQWLQGRGVSDFVLSLGHGAQQVLDTVSVWSGKFKLRHVVEPEAFGTGGAVLHCMRTLGLRQALVVNGDTFVGGDLDALLAPLDTSAGEIVRLAVVEVPNRARFGGVQVGADGRVCRFVEKGEATPGPINAGLYNLLAEAFSPDDGRVFSLEQHVFARLVKRRQLAASFVDGPFIDIGVPDDYARFQHGYREYALRGA